MRDGVCLALGQEPQEVERARPAELAKHSLGRLLTEVASESSLA